MEFSLTLKEIKEKVLPEVTDEWVAGVCEFKTVDEFRADIRSRLQSAKDYTVDQKYRAVAVAKAVENVTVDLPEVVVQREAAEMLSELKSSVEARGLTLEGYMGATGMTFEKLVEGMIPRATDNVKTRLVLDAVAKAEKLEVTDEEVQATIGQMALANRHRRQRAREAPAQERPHGRAQRADTARQGGRLHSRERGRGSARGRVRCREKARRQESVRGDRWPKPRPARPRLPRSRRPRRAAADAATELPVTATERRR